ncbi:MAG: hypothetical protein Q7R40_12050 [Phaeospirillum sp.]|nr:hypothetical protein [Phaeospirillum sp.]
MFAHCRHTELVTEISATIDVAEGYRDYLANPEARAKWHGIWLSIEAMLEWLFEQEARILHASCIMDWLAVANTHAIVVAPVCTMIDECKSGRAHRRANLAALEHVVLMLSQHKAQYDKVGTPKPSLSPADDHPRQEYTAVQCPS